MLPSNLIAGRFTNKLLRKIRNVVGILEVILIIHCVSLEIPMAVYFLMYQKLLIYLLVSRGCIIKSLHEILLCNNIGIVILNVSHVKQLLSLILFHYERNTTQHTYLLFDVTEVERIWYISINFLWF